MEGLCQWCLLITVGLVHQGASDPCNLESSLNPEGYVVWDNDGFKRQASDDSESGADRRICDRHLGDHFYRLMHPSGTRLHNSCVFEQQKCGAEYPIWMDGDYPSESEGLVTRRVCTSYPSISDCCHLENTIEIKNCGEFYVFKIPASLGCDYAYCFATDDQNDTTVTSIESSTTLNSVQANTTEQNSAVHIKVTTVELTLTPRILESTEEQEVPVTLKETEEFSEMTFLVGSVAGLVIGVTFAVITVGLVIRYKKSLDSKRENEGSNTRASETNAPRNGTIGHCYTNESQRCHGNVIVDLLKDNTISTSKENVYTEIQENNLIETVDIIPERNSTPFYIEIIQNGDQNRHFPDYLELITDHDGGGSEG